MILLTELFPSNARCHAIATLAPSRPSTPLSCGFGLDARPFRFEKNPSIPDGFKRTGVGDDLSARSDHDPASSKTTCTPPLEDWFLIPDLNFPILCLFCNCCSFILERSVEDTVGGIERGGGHTLGRSVHDGIGGDPDAGEPTNDFWDFWVVLIETGLV